MSTLFREINIVDLESYKKGKNCYITIFKNKFNYNSLRWMNYILKIGNNYKNVITLILDWREYTKVHTSIHVNNFYSIIILNTNDGLRIYSDPSYDKIEKAYRYASTLNFTLNNMENCQKIGIKDSSILTTTLNEFKNTEFNKLYAFKDNSESGPRKSTDILSVSRSRFFSERFSYIPPRQIESNSPPKNHFLTNKVSVIVQNPNLTPDNHINKLTV